MSHLTTYKNLILNDQEIVQRVAKKFSWRVMQVPKFVNRYSGETVHDATVLLDGTTPKLVIDEFGHPVVDDYFMGQDYKRFLQEYAAERISSQAAVLGAFVIERRMEEDGWLTVTVEV